MRIIRNTRLQTVPKTDRIFLWRKFSNGNDGILAVNSWFEEVVNVFLDGIKMLKHH